MDKLLVYQPDIVLLVVNHSDIFDVIRRGGMERFLPDGKVKGVDPPDMPWLYESSQFGRLILFELFDYTHLFVTRSERETKARKSLEKIMTLVNEYNVLLESKGIDFSLVILPFRGELKRNQYDMLNQLSEFSLQRQIDIIDTKPYLYKKLIAHEKRIDDLYWSDDSHFTELGYRYLAEAVKFGLYPKISHARTRING